MTKLLKIEGVQVPAISKKTEKAIENYLNALNKVRADVSIVKQRKAQAEKNIKELEAKLGYSGVDVLTVQDETKRKRLIEELEEEKLYLLMNIEEYKKRRIEDERIEELKAEATQEFQAFKTTAEAYRDELIRQAEQADETVRNMINANSFNQAQALYTNVTGGRAYAIEMYKVKSTKLVNKSNPLQPIF